MPVIGPVGTPVGAIPRRVPSGPIHATGMQGQAVPPNAWACSDSSTPPVLVVLNHSSVAIPPVPGSNRPGRARYEEVPLNEAAGSSPAPNAPCVPSVTAL